MNSTNTKENKQNNQSYHSRGSSNLLENVHEYKTDKGENQTNGNNNSLHIPIQNNNIGSSNNLNPLPKYYFDKLPDLSARDYDDNHNEFEKQRSNQRSSGSLYRHNNESMNLFNPYIGKTSRSFSQKTLPSAVLLQQVKQERTIVLEQNQMLINRLRKLRQEEISLQKSAEDTTKRAEKVFQQKKFYIKKREEEQQRMQQQDEITYTHPRKQLEMLKVQIAIEEKLKEKKKGFYEVKQIIAEEQIRKAIEEKAQINNIKFKMEQMKKQKEASKLKKEKFLQEKKQKVEKDIQRQRVKEEALLSFAKFETKDFEKREQEMLERIRKTQFVKEQAKEQLKDSVTLDIPQYESRYLKERKNSNNTSLTFLNTNIAKRQPAQKGVGSNYNSNSISQQTLKVGQNGQTYISNDP